MAFHANPAQMAADAQEEAKTVMGTLMNMLAVQGKAPGKGSALDPALLWGAQLVTEWLQNDTLKDAALALKLMSHWMFKLKDTVGPLLEAVKDAERAVRDNFVLRCRAEAPPRNRDAFLALAEEAYGGDMPEKEIADVLLAYRKRCGFCEDAFESKNQAQARRRGWPRQRRNRRSPDGGNVHDVSDKIALTLSGVRPASLHILPHL